MRELVQILNVPSEDVFLFLGGDYSIKGNRWLQIEYPQPDFLYLGSYGYDNYQEGHQENLVE